jgi:hypothetical protein
MRIVYLSWPAGEISGGIKAVFQHVELLAEAGFDARVATPDGAAPGWFETGVQPMPMDHVRIDDVLVLPENSAKLLQRFADAPNPKLVFCQNPYLVYRGLQGMASFATAGVSHILCPSHTVLQFCRRRFPGMKLGYTPYYIDHRRFACSASGKVLQIAAIPRKRAIEFGAIADLFGASYPQYRLLPWVYLDQATEAEVAQTLARSAVYLSLARLEAHGMAALEAMASGCLVAGFAGVVGGTDSATARNGFWAAEDDVPGCVDQLARAVQLAIDRGPVFDEMVAEGRRTAWEYRREEAARRLVDFWRLTLPELRPA